MIRDLRPYIGIPFDVMDCWQLVGHFYANEYGIILPDLSSEYSDPGDEKQTRPLYERELANQHWPETLNPQFGDLVVFMIYKTLPHVGIFLSPGNMLHTQRGCNSVIESFNRLRWRNRFTGFYRYELPLSAI